MSDLEQMMMELIGGGAPDAVGVTPRLTARSQNLPGQGYDKMKADLKANPQDPMAPGMTGTSMPQDPAIVEALLQQIMEGQGSGVTPEIISTKAGAPMRANTNLMSTILAQVLGMTGKDEKPDGPEDDRYGDGDEDD